VALKMGLCVRRGEGCRSQRGESERRRALVQFLLTEIGKDHTTNPLKSILKVDGKYSPVLTAWILWFQMKVRSLGKSIAVDGRVHPTNGDFSVPWTMWHMNATYARRFPVAHNGLELGSSVPNELRQKLKPPKFL
jgi:hypothetical protein